MSKKLYGYVSKDNLEYKWKSEPTACKVCKSMNGKIYKSANDIPDRPHPNCKCWIDVLEKEPKEPITDPIELYREKLKDRKRNELELAKLLGDVKSLEQEIDEYIGQTEEQENEIAKFEQEFDIETLEEKDKQKLSDIKEQIDYAQYKGQKAKTDIQNLKTEIQSAKGTIEEITKFEFEVRNISKYVDNMLQSIKKLSNEIKQTLDDVIIVTLKIAQDSVVDKLSKIGPDAAALWRISSSKFTKGLDYINKNGQIINELSELNNTKLINEVNYKIKSQLKNPNAKGIVFHENSTLAKSIVKSKEFNKFISEHIYELCVENKVMDTHFNFISDINNLASLRKARAIDIQVKNGLLYATVIDTVDYNSKDWTVIIPRILQEHDMLEGYYHVTKIIEPISIWLYRK